MSTALALPKSKLLTQLSTTRARARDMTRIAEQARPPVMVLAASAAGSVSAGALGAFLAPERAMIGQIVLGALGVLGGGIAENPDMVNFGCGALGLALGNKTTEVLKARKARPATPAPDDEDEDEAPAPRKRRPNKRAAQAAA